MLRRTTFGPFPGGVQRALDAHRSIADLIDAQIAVDPLPFKPPASIDHGFKQEDEPLLGNNELIRHWLRRMGRSDAGLHERMMWFWHTHFTTSAAKTTFTYQWRQLRRFHRLALGNFRDLTKAMVADAAMMTFLDADGSFIQAPNENLGRELMELFTMGRGHYTEADVRAASRGLSGRYVNSETCEPVLVPQSGPTQPDTFLGRTQVYDPDSLVDQILAQDAVAPFIARKVWRHFVGGTPDDDTIARWGRVLRAADYEIEPLMREVLHSEAFATAQRSRARTGVEWFVPMVRALGVPHDAIDQSQLDRIGQAPYFPPNVAGWPDTGWLAGSSLLARASVVMALPTRVPDLGRGADAVDAALERCGIHDASTSTTRSLRDLERSTTSDRSTALVRAAVLTPEFVVA